MAIAFDAASSGKVNATPLSFSHTIGGGSDRMAVIAVNIQGSAGTFSATFNGMAFTLAILYESSAYHSLIGYILHANLPAAGTYTVAVNYFSGTPVGTDSIQAECTTLTGVAQQAPEATASNVVAFNATSVSTNITTLTDNAWVVDGICTNGNITVITVAAGQTSRATQSSTATISGSSTKPVVTAGSTSMGWTFNANNGGGGTHVLAAFTASGGVIPTKDVRVKTGTITTPAGTGNVSTTSIGFTPKCIYFYWTANTTNPQVNAITGHGMTDGTAHRCINAAGADAAQDTFRSRSITIPVEIRNMATTVVVAASYVSFDIDGFTLNFTTTAVGYTLNYVVFGGTDVTAKVATFTMSASPATGFANSPEFAIVMASNGTGATVDTFGTQCIGFFNAALEQFHHASYHGDDANDQTEKRSLLRSTGFCSQVVAGGLTYELSISTITVDGFSWTGSNADVMDVLGLNLKGVLTKLAVFTKSVAAAPVDQSLPTMGFVPQAYCLMSANRTDQAATVANVINAYGWHDRERTNSILATDVNSSLNADMRNATDAVIQLGTASATVDAKAIPKAVSIEPVQVTWNPNSATASLIGLVGIASQDVTSQLIFAANF